MVLPQTLPIPQETVVASFDATDVAEGAGIINYNASSAQVQTTKTYFLTRTDIPSDEVYTFVTSSNTGAAVEVLNIDFDITLQAPKNLAKGTAHIILALGIGSEVTTAKTLYAVATLKKNTTTIGSSVRSRDVVRPDPTSANAPYSDVVNIPIVISSRVHFKINDIIRVNIVLWATSASGAADFALGHDPADRNDPRPAALAQKIFEDDKSTKSIISLPFVLNI